jgi:hypothetical protein
MTVSASGQTVSLFSCLFFVQTENQKSQPLRWWNKWFRPEGILVLLHHKLSKFLLRFEHIVIQMQSDLFNMISLNALFSKTSCIVTMSPAAVISEKEWIWLVRVQISCLHPDLTALQISLPSIWWQSEKVYGLNQSQNTSCGHGRRQTGGR